MIRCLPVLAWRSLPPNFSGAGSCEAAWAASAAALRRAFSRSLSGFLGFLLMGAGFYHSLDSRENQPSPASGHDIISHNISYTTNLSIGLPQATGPFVIFLPPL